MCVCVCAVSGRIEDLEADSAAATPIHHCSAFAHSFILHLLTLLSCICSLFYRHYFLRHHCFVRVVGSWAWNWMEPPLGQVSLPFAWSFCCSLIALFVFAHSFARPPFFMLFVRGARSRSSCSACSSPGLKMPSLVFGLIRPSSRPCVPIKLCESSLSTMRLCWPISARV